LSVGPVLPFSIGAPVFSVGCFLLPVRRRLFVNNAAVRKNNLLALDLYPLDQFDLLVD